METSDSGSNSTSKKSRIYFALGVFFLFAMALLWSFDDSVVYILLGAASFFLFMGFYTYPRIKKHEPHSAYAKSSGVEARESLSAMLARIFKSPAENAKRSGTVFTKPTATSRAKYIPRVITVFFLIFFGIIFISIIFSSDDTPTEAIGYYQQADQYYWSGNYDSAVANYRKAWTLNPTYAEAILGYGNSLMMQKKYDSALLTFDQALAINAEMKEASYAKALTYYYQQNYEESIRILRDLLVNYSDYGDARLLLADTYYTQNKYDDALPVYEDIYEDENARTSTLCHVMAYIYDTKGDSQRAIGLYKEALGYDSTIVDIYRRLGEMIQTEEGNYFRTQAVKLQSQQ